MIDKISNEKNNDFQFFKGDWKDVDMDKFCRFIGSDTKLLRRSSRLANAIEILEDFFHLTLHLLWLSPFKSVFSIALYSTASIGEKVYIIGGIQNENRISEYNDEQWTDYGSLFTSREFHSSISFNSKTMILGGFSGSVSYEWVIINIST